MKINRIQEKQYKSIAKYLDCIEHLLPFATWTEAISQCSTALNFEVTKSNLRNVWVNRLERPVNNLVHGATTELQKKEIIKRLELLNERVSELEMRLGNVINRLNDTTTI